VAGDLIPPPSPAGKPPPDPEGEPLGTARLEPATHPAADAAPRASAGRPAPAPFRGRFGFVWGALAGIAVCAAGLLALLVVTGRSQDGPVLAPNWSAWEPDTSQMTEGAEAIASRVGLQYKLEGGEQLVQVRSSALELGGEEIGVAVRPLGGGLELLQGEGLLYILNGLGPNGRVASGAPSKERGRLLLREALELALYSFRYLDDVTMVAVLLPQTADQAAAGAGRQAATQQTRAVFYRPGDLLEQLQVPLDRTLSPRTPTPTTMADAEADRVDDLTLRNLFLASIQPLEADRNYLVLVEPDTVE
jgi:hypothetical protein